MLQNRSIRRARHMKHSRPDLRLPILAIFVALFAAGPLDETTFARQPARSKAKAQLDENIRSMRQKAEEGIMDAQMVMAEWCLNGDMLPMDHAEAARWYGMAARQGSVEAMMALGRMLIEGDGVPKDARKSCEWYIAAAKRGNPEAYMELGRILEEGDGVPADRTKAARLYEEGAKRGSTNAASMLASVHDANPAHDREAQTVPDWDSQSPAPDFSADDWGFDASENPFGGWDRTTPVEKPVSYDREKARQYDLELQRRAEQEWNDFARQNGGAQFVGKMGSGQMTPAPQANPGMSSGRSEQAVMDYAQGIIELASMAAGFESQIDPMVETIQGHQRTAKYSSDWNEQRYALHQAEVWIGTLNGIMEQYRNATGQLMALYMRDGPLFRDAMLMIASTPECHPIVRNYCRNFFSGSERATVPQSQPRRNSAPRSFESEVQQTLRQGWLEAIQAGQ